ncbi:MAG: substrate-binding domain-containing protein [Treponema sp.]|nr:substrate-binding domain-containing protein [Treponema sp.]
MLDRDDPLPLYFQLSERIKKQIESGQIKVGDKLPSESEMVEAYGIGRLTVRGALSHLVNTGYLKKIHGKGTYCISAGAAAEKLNINIILDLAYTYFVPYYLKSISAALSANNCNIIVNDSHDNAEKISEILEGILREGSSGVIVQPVRILAKTPERLKNAFRGLRSAGIPYIMIDSVFEDVDGSFTVLDERKGGAVAARYLYQLGHRYLAMIYPVQYRDSLYRKDGFSEACASLGVPPPLFIPYDQKQIKNLAAVLKSGGVTALFCYNDELAVEVLRVLKDSGIKVPGGISVLGFDDSVLASTVEPALTSIAHPKQLMGDLAAKALLDLINKKTLWPFVHYFAPKLVKRESCARLSGKADP